MILQNRLLEAIFKSFQKFSEILLKNFLLSYKLLAEFKK